MPITIRDYTGSILAGSDGRVTDLTTFWSTKTSIHKLPGANKDLVQKLGISNRRFTLKGFVTTYSGSVFLEAANNNSGSMSFSSNLNAVLMNYTRVFYYELEWLDSGLRPLERRFTLSAVEII